jgi:amino acid adenylation domain-containing protein
MSAISAFKNVEDIYPMVPVQQGLLFHTLYAPGAGLYCEQLACTIQGGFVPDAFRRAWQRVLQRHPVLRTAFVWDQLEQPLQVVRKELPLPWTQQDWRGTTSDAQAELWQAFLREDRRRGFQLDQAPLFRLVLIQIEEDAYHFLWSHHHLLLDGWSSSLVLKEVLAVYAADVRGVELSLEPVRPYRDYLAWLAKQDLSKAEAFWVEALRGFDCPTPLPTGRAPAVEPESAAAYEEQQLAVPTVLTASLQAFVRRLQLPLNALMQGAWALLLSRYSGRDDVVFGVTMSGRPPTLAGVESMVGLAINTLPLRVRIPPGASLRDWLKRLHAQQVGIQEYEYTPLVQVQRWSEVTNGVPLFDSLFVFENYPVDRALRNGLDIPKFREIRTWTRANYPLSVIVLPGHGLNVRILYDTGRLDAAMVSRMLDHYQRLLETMVADAEQPLGRIPMVTDEERHRALVQWNENARPYPRDSCIHVLFEEHVARAPDATAVVWGLQRLTYAELNRRANQLARYLRSVGVGDESMVGVHLPRSPELAVTLLGILKAGGAYVPLDPAYPAERLALMMQDCAASILLTRSDLLADWEPTATRVVLVDAVRDLIDGMPEENLGTSSPDQLAYVIYTSGSTGIPKGVAVPHRAVVRLVKGADYVRLGPADRVAQVSNASFDAATFEIWGALLNGGSLIGVEREVMLSPHRFADLLRAEQITALFLTTALFNQVAREVPDAFCEVTHLLFGGEAVAPESVRRVLKAGAPRRLLHVYGPTENTTFSSWQLLLEVSSEATTLPIGRAIAHSQLYLLDRQLDPVPVGTPGELYVGGDGLARGYLNRSDSTAERFIPDPFSPLPGARLYRTGDMGRYLADGSVEFLGRTDTQVKIRGFRVELGEIETVLARHPSLRETVVTYADQRLTAYVVAAVSDAPSGGELRRFLSRSLPEHMIPADFVTLDQLPINLNGKVDRRRLPQPSRTSASEPYATARTPTEEIITGIWSRVLDQPKLGVDDDFFELGGHSLLATQVMSRLREAFKVELPLRLLFQSPTVAGLAVHVESARRISTTQPSTIVRAERNGPMALSFAQERLWFLDQLEPGNPFYNVSIALSLKGPLQIPALESSINAVVQRHEVLRSAFPTVDDRPVQVGATLLLVPLPVIDLSEFTHERLADEVKRLTLAEARQPFALATGPLLRTRLLRLRSDDHVFLFTMHHIVADGWSLGVLVKELVFYYEEFSRHGAEQSAVEQNGRKRGSSDAFGTGLDPTSSRHSISLAELKVQYSDFAAWQRDWLRGEVLDTQLTYWRRQLTDVPPVLELPTDRPRPPTQSYQGRAVRFQIDARLTGALRRLGRQRDSTLFMTLLSAFATLLYRSSGKDDIVIGSPIANRNRGEIEPLIGFFVNTLALRVDLSGNPTFEELLGRVRQTALDAYSHQDLPFEKLVDEIQPERDLSLNPLFQVMFTLQNAPLQPLNLSGLSVELMETEHTSALFDIVMDVWETGDSLSGILEYNSDLFDEWSALRMVRNYQTLLESIEYSPVRRLDDLPWLTEGERHTLIALGTGPRRDYPVDRTIHELFEQTAAAHSERIAAVHNCTRITYADLDSRANQIAHRLRRHGVKPDDFVGILDHRGIDALAAMLGVLKAGGAFLPLDSMYPSERLKHMLADSQVQILISRTARLKELAPGSFHGHCVLLDDAGLGREPTSPPERVARGTGLAYLSYTSGTTGLPKGAMVRHDGAVNHIFAEFELLRFHPATAFLQSAPSSSDISVWQYLAPLLIGGRTTIVDYETVCDPASLFQTIQAERITLIELVPAVMKGLLDHAARLTADERALPDLEWAMVTGEAATPALVNQWLSTYAGIRLVNAYGPTEAADDICQIVLNRAIESDRDTVPIGRPLPNLTLYVLDRNLQLVPRGVKGEICVSGIGVGDGYWRNEATTAERFVSSPYAGEGRGDRLYRTGDLGRWLPDDTLECLERLDSQVKVRGFRIELGEIESVLAGHPAIREAAVVVQDCANGDKQLVGYYVPEADSPETRARLEDLKLEQIDLWQDLHEDSYRDERVDGDVTFNLVGWDSNYTATPLPDDDMHEYVDHTIARILTLTPRRVLEIGCGTGLIMFPLLPHCESYAGSDLSRAAIDRLAELQRSEQFRARIPGLDRARLRQRRADDLDWVETAGYDTVVLASVVQYFPGVDYLLRVFDGIFNRALSHDGSVFVGDVRSQPLLEAFHASVQLHKADPSASPAEIARRVRLRLAREQELAIEPAFFLALTRRYPAIKHVEILPKRGFHQNEMTRFRYDVLIRTEAGTTAESVDSWLDWRADRPSLGELRGRLTQDRPGTLALRRVANLRVQEALATIDWLYRGDRFTRAGDLKAALAESAFPGLELEDLVRLADECSYQVDLSAAGSYPDGSFDVVFRRQIGADALPPPSFVGDVVPKPWNRYANNPLHEKLARTMQARLREFLKEKLPHYMVPSHFALLPNLPRTPAGKVDRQALPAPDPSQRESDESYVAPRDREEQALAGIWAEVLGVTRVGIHNNFFELGGHSLKATQVVSNIQRNFHIQIDLRDLFNHPTIAELAPRLRSSQAAQHVPIPKATEAEYYPLSHAQRRLWVLSQIGEGSAAYNMPVALLMEGSIVVEAFQVVLGLLVQRHESLRTAFPVVNGVPQQKILPDAVCELGFVDLSREDDPDEAAHQLALEDASAPFDLEKGMLVRASLLSLNANRHVLLFNTHHIISDDQSMIVLVREFVRLYSAVTRGESVTLPPLPIQYRDYSSWQNEYLRSEAGAVHREYWHRKLAGELPLLNLATDWARPPVRTYHGRTMGFQLDTEQTAALSALGRARNASLFMTVVAVTKVLLYRQTGQEEILVGFPISGRNHADLENQIGFFINTLPLRDRVCGDGSFNELLDQVKTTAAEAYEHQVYPLDRLVDELDVVRDVSRSPMFDVIVALQYAEMPESSIEGISVHPFVRRYDTSKFDLSFTFEERVGGLQVYIVYNTDLFAPERIKYVSGQFRELVASILEDQAAPIDKLNMLSDTERQEVLGELARTLRSHPRQHTITSLFESQAARTPDRAAVVYPATASDVSPVEAGALQQLTYRELNESANRLAHYLRRCGVGPDVLVGLCLPRSIDLVVGLLGILKAGGAYLPMDTGHPRERLAFMMDDARVSALVTLESLLDQAPSSAARILCLDRDRDLIARERADDPDPGASPDHLAYVIYTSGSTGRPKGVAVTHHNVVRLFKATASLFAFDEHDVWTLFHSCSFDFSVWELWGALLHGGRAVVVPYWVSRSPDAFYELLWRDRVTVLNQTPSAFRQLMQVDDDTGTRRELSLRSVIFGGEALELQSLRPWLERHGDQKPRLVNMYGITETTVHVTYRPISLADLAAPGSLIGNPLPDLSLYILDRNRQPVPVGVAGELYVGGDGVARGYLNRPELTRERFIDDPFSTGPGARLYRSGDLARSLPGGDIEYLGRIDHQVQIRGFRVELGEIQSVMTAHPGVREAFVYAHDQGGQVRLAGYFVPAGEDAPSASVLRRHLQVHLPDYMVPSVLISMDAFPLTLNGKLDRALLPRPGESQPEIDAAYIRPEGDLEVAIASVLQHVLGVDRVGLNDNFFELGANSLLIMQAYRKLRDDLKLDIPVVMMFQFPTIAALAARLGDRPSAEHPSPTQQAHERVMRRKSARRNRNR